MQTAEATVRVRVQVIDLRAFALDLRVPTYLPAKDLTQRIARDAGLEAFWADGRRRLYWLRARGRLLHDQETLAQLGVVDGELVYLLPEPPAGSGVVEQAPDYPATRGYTGRGGIALVGGLLAVFGFAALWGVALSADRHWATVTVPGFGLGVLCATFARHAWGGRSTNPGIAVTAVALVALAFALALAVPLGVTPEPVASLVGTALPGLFSGLGGVLAGWIAWWGAVEPLPARVAAVVDEAPVEEAAVACAICGGQVDATVRTDCPYACGRSFHSGCYKTRLAVFTGDASRCAVCQAQIR